MVCYCIPSRLFIYIFVCFLLFFLRHKETSRIRVLMRQEKTMKVLTNHFLDPRIQLLPNAGSDKSRVWNCFDFAENELLETVSINNILYSCTLLYPAFWYLLLALTEYSIFLFTLLILILFFYCCCFFSNSDLCH